MTTQYSCLTLLSFDPAVFPSEFLTSKELTAMVKGYPPAVAAYNESLDAARFVLQNPASDVTNGAKHYILDYGQIKPLWAKVPSRVSFGPFTNTGGGDVPNGATVHIRILP